MTHESPTLQERYPTALYTYFRISNVAQAYAEFLKDTTRPPVFSYGRLVQKDYALQRLESLQKDLQLLHDDDDAERAFVQRRLQETNILLLFCELHNGEKLLDVDTLQRYREMQIGLYGTVKPEIFSGIVGRLKANAITKKSKTGLSIVGQLQQNEDDSTLGMPTQQTFDMYKQQFARTFPKLHTLLLTVPARKSYSVIDAKKIFEEALQAIGADRFGWQVVISPHGAHVVVSKHSKRILLSEHWQPRTPLRFKQILAHEVGCHVQLALNETQNIPVITKGEEEGLAIVLEQLLGKRFVHKRAMRYLALCLALGVDGRPRNFCETYEIMTTAMKLIGGTPSQAKQRAFYETARVFRGGFPAVPGGVYIKDKVYLESNLKVWSLLESDPAGHQFEHIFHAKNTHVKGAL